MELTLNQVLQKGIEAHKAGNAQEADRYYTAILKSQPKHPDANHNMGVLAVGVGKVEAALPFFKTALEANPKIEQFWLSYINALITLNRMVDAKAVFEEAKSNATKGDGFAQIEELLGSSIFKSSNTQEPSQEQLQNLITLYTQGQYKESLNKGSQLQEQFPNSSKLCNIIGAANLGLGKIEEAIESFNKALYIKPDYVEAHNNLGNALQDQGKLEEAIEAYSKAISIKPDYVEAYYNMGVVFKDQGKLDEAASFFRKNESIKSQTWLLKCLYELNNKSHFYDQLDYLISQGENNAIIGSYISRSKIRYGINRENPYCDDPLKYVLEIDLLKKCDFQEVFVKGAVTILNEGIVQKKKQSLVMNGNQTAGNVFGQMGQHREKIQDLILTELENYRLNYKDSSVGLISNWPTNYRLDGWIVKYKNGGAIKPHMHEEGWISGSVYINVPPELKDDSGNLVVCIESETAQASLSKSINVVTGSLCLFPSSLLHYTIPFESSEDRIVLAFDMIPKI
ncbi:tetratricopeptide repeat protein [Paracoccaceae bacterium]|nr:tetratricopeptide repeat protein [Paracoccaceae bacterium]